MQYLEMRKGRVEIIPMIDIMLFLLIFFIMVTIHMIPTQGLPAQMPGSSTARDLPKPKVVLTLRQSGEVEMDGHAISLPDLEARLRQAIPPRPRSPSPPTRAPTSRPWSRSWTPAATPASAPSAWRPSRSRNLGRCPRIPVVPPPEEGPLLRRALLAAVAVELLVIGNMAFSSGRKAAIPVHSAHATGADRSERPRSFHRHQDRQRNPRRHPSPCQNR